MSREAGTGGEGIAPGTQRGRNQGRTATGEQEKMGTRRARVAKGAQVAMAEQLQVSRVRWVLEEQE